MNKEALRKELEDCWDAAERYASYTESLPLDVPDKIQYITTRLAALDDDRELTKMCMTASEKSLAKDWVDDGQEGKGLEEWDYCDECKKLVIGNAVGAGEEYLHTECPECDSITTKIDVSELVKRIQFKPLDDGQEGKGLRWDELRDLFESTTKIPSEQRSILHLESFIQGYNAQKSSALPVGAFIEFVTNIRDHQCIDGEDIPDPLRLQAKELLGSLPSAVTGGVKWNQQTIKSYSDEVLVQYALEDYRLRINADLSKEVDEEQIGILEKTREDVKRLLMNFTHPDNQDPSKRLISMVERRMQNAGITNVLIDNLPKDEYRDMIYNFFTSLREI